MTRDENAAIDPRAICAKWVSRLGLGFHPDTDANNYAPPLSGAEQLEYDEDMEGLFLTASDPYAVGLEAMREAGLLD